VKGERTALVAGIRGKQASTEIPLQIRLLVVWLNLARNSYYGIENSIILSCMVSSTLSNFGICSGELPVANSCRALASSCRELPEQQTVVEKFLYSTQLR